MDIKGKLNIKNMKKGFTLIEIIIATAIFSILSGGGIASYISFNQREKLKATALEIKTKLRQAQTYALAGVKNEGECGNRPLDGWCIDLSRSYIYGHCGGPVGKVPAPVDFNIESFSLPKGVSISFSPPQGGILLFKPLGQGVDQSLTICLTGFGKKYKLFVGTAGEITDYGFVQNCP